MPIKMKTKSESFVVHYPEAVTFADEQIKILWTHGEIKVEKDIHDILTNFDESEKHAVITALKLFTLYELKAGADYWCGRYMKTYPRPELERMAATFGMFELAIHKPFYNKINEALHLNNDEFYTSYVKDPTLKARMDFIDGAINDPDDLYSTGVFSMVEGAILYSSFAFLKHFQSKGKNKALNVVRGINFSVRDENMHSEAGSWSYRTQKKEEQRSAEEMQSIETRIKNAALMIFEHESRIIDMMWEKGDISGITKDDLKIFVKSRINICLGNLEIEPIFEIVPETNTIETWFYDSINKFVFNDFFSGIGREYVRDWDEESFNWKTEEELEKELEGN